MPHVPSRTHFFTGRATSPKVQAKVAWLPFLRAFVLGGALLLADGVRGYAAEAGASGGAAPMPVKAPPRPKRTAKAPKGIWDFTAPKQQAASRPYTSGIAGQHVQSLVPDIAVLAAVSIYIGIKQWGWGETRWHPFSEGWFGKSTAFGGIDKFGHAWSAHVMSDYFTWRLQSQGYGTYESALTAAMLSGVAFLTVEIGDGFSHYGASYEDFVASGFGIGFSFLRNTVPGLAEKVDFRMQYIPTGHGDTYGLGDYSGKKFVLAWKFAGFQELKDGPLRYLELHTGYYTRGYSDWESAAGIAPSRSPYVGIGLNLSELLFSHPSVRDTPLASLGRTLRTYIQVPYTYIANDSFR
jgi:hypothetical protein